jgi:hypothetical protein
MPAFKSAIKKALKQPIVANAATAEVRKILKYFNLQVLNPIVGAKTENELWFNTAHLDEKQDWIEVITTRAVKCTPNYTDMFNRLVVTIIFDEKTNYGVVCRFNGQKAD